MMSEVEASIKLYGWNITSNVLPGFGSSPQCSAPRPSRNANAPTRIMNYELRIKNYELRILNYEL